MQIFDSHTHINADQFVGDLPAVVERARALDVTHMLVLGDNKRTNARLMTMLEQFPHIFGAAGCHPEDASQYDKEWEGMLREMALHPRFRVIGEIGLDYHCAVDHRLQWRVFEAQLTLAEELGLPVSIHNRDAFADTYAILQDHQPALVGGVMHSFNGDAQWAKKFLALGFNLSYSGVVTFHGAPEVREAAQVTPLSRMLVETDAPYLTPMPYRDRMNEPGMTRYTVEYLARLRGIPALVLARQTFNNAMRMIESGKQQANEN
ncbi:TatD family hydrolase [Ligilactobacillus sp. LYQ60]|uniref:TatD family hydrolase n=1 Tax=unclassified Ligilactobacillus TaxID=2767920 RepID=UPI003852E992